MTLQNQSAEIEIKLKIKGFSPMAIEKIRIALDQYKLKTRKELAKFQRRVKHIKTEDNKNYENNT